jgi:hypothetical protein
LHGSKEFGRINKRILKEEYHNVLVDKSIKKKDATYFAKMQETVIYASDKELKN